MPRSDVTHADRISLHEQIENQPPNTSYHQLTEITEAPKSTIAHVIQQQEKLWDEWTLRHGQQGTSKKWKREGKIQMLKRPLIGGSL
jgi:hypothetical protein